VRIARPSTQRLWSLRERLDEHDIANLITVYRRHHCRLLAAAHGLNLKSVNASCTRRRPPNLTHTTS
jgi:hypothetical protein